MSVENELLPSPPQGTEWIPIARGESGNRIYKLSDGSAYAKVPSQRSSELSDERSRAEWLSTRSDAAPKVLDWIETEQGACLVTATIPGVPADKLDASELRAAWPALCRALKTIHELPLDQCPFERRLPSMMKRAADVVARQAVRSSFLSPETRNTPPAALLARLNAELPKRLAQEQDDLVVCHGDACLPNLLVDPSTLRCNGVIDLGRLGLADRYADLSLLLANARHRWRDDNEVAAAEGELFAIHELQQCDRDRLAFYALLDPLTWG